MDLTLLSMDPLDWRGILCTLGAGAVIGLERQLRGKPVGIRTSALICLGTYIFVVISNTVLDNHTDASRVIGQVITGIGFLGAGVMMARDGIILGVTSAAAIWMLAAIGVTIGTGHYLSGVKIALLVVIILGGVDLLEDTFKFLQRGVHRKVVGMRQRNSDNDQDRSFMRRNQD